MVDFDVENDEMQGGELDDQFGNTSSRTAKRKEFKKTNYFNLEKGDNFFRVMPEMFTGIEKNLWAVYYVRHWGYKKENGQKQPFLCTRKYDPKTRMISHECEFCKDYDTKSEMIKSYQAGVAKLNKNLVEAQNNGTDDEVEGIETQIGDIQSKMSEIRGNLGSVERRFWVNAMNRQGEFGVLPVPKTVFEQLAGKRNKDGTRVPGLIKTLQEDEGISALDVTEGVTFKITRTGSDQFDTEYKSDVETETIELNGRKTKQTKLTPLSNEQKTRALKDCSDLVTMFDHLVLSDAEMKTIVNGSGAAVSALAARPTKTEKKETVADEGFGSSATRGVPRSTKGQKTDEEILAELKSIL